VTYRVEDLTNAITTLFGRGGEHTLDVLFHHLKKHPVVLPPMEKWGGASVAELVEHNCDDDTQWFILAVTSHWDKVRHFHVSTKAGYSFGGVSFSDITEVNPTPVQRTEWTPV
jgi:hypothetical protein